MVVENKKDFKNPDIAGNNGSILKPSKKFNLSRLKSRKGLLAVTAALVIVLAGWAILSRTLHVGEKVYAQAGGHKIYQKEVKDLIGNSKDVSDHDAAEVLADKYLTEALAKEQNISVSDEDLAKQYGPDIKNQKTQNKYASQKALNKLYFLKLSTNLKGTYKGQLIVAQFSRYVPYKSTLLKEVQKVNPKVGNAQLIAEDKKYAEDFITSLYDQVKSGKISFDQAIKLEQNDSRVGMPAYPSQNHSGVFDTSFDWTSLIDNASAIEQLQKLNPGEISKPFVVRADDSASDPKSTAESYFLVIKLDSKSGGGQVNTNSEQYIEEAIKRLRYKINV